MILLIVRTCKFKVFPSVLQNAQIVKPCEHHPGTNESQLQDNKLTPDNFGPKKHGTQKAENINTGKKSNYEEEHGCQLAFLR